ncbi:sugar phosphate isomerase/epimerase [Micrococcales bacterium 31B]|nr:sugar phosphate isomerase/epimerase [Micrococcales bacterium 31B]
MNGRPLSLEEKFEIAVAWGFDALELRPRGDGEFARRLPELRRAVKNGVCLPTGCIEMAHFIGAFDRELREDAVAQLASILRVMGELRGLDARCGVGTVTPTAWGMFSTRLPPFTPPRSQAEDREVLLDALARLAKVANECGTTLLLEPLNRYETHMVNTLGEAADLLCEVGSPALGVCADTYHMNIEEARPLAALREHAALIKHVQLSDSNRLEPGAGHVDFAGYLEVLHEVGYKGDLAWESRLSGVAAECLPMSVEHVRARLPRG